MELRNRGVTDGCCISASFAAFSNDTIELAGENLNGTYIWNKFDINYPEESWRQFVSVYKQTHDGEIPFASPIPDMYDAVMAIAQCYEELNITGLETKHKEESEKVAQWFYNSPKIHGIQGDFAWVKGEKVATYHFFQFSNTTPYNLDSEK